MSRRHTKRLPHPVMRTLERLATYKKVDDALAQTKKETGIDPNPYFLGLAGLAGLFFSSAAKDVDHRDVLEDASVYLLTLATAHVAAEALKPKCNCPCNETKGTKGTANR